MLWEYRRLEDHQLGGRDAAHLLKPKVMVLLKRLNAIRHPQALSVERINRAPVHRRGTRAQRLVDAVPEANALDEG